MSGWQLSGDAPTAYDRFELKVMEPWTDDLIRSAPLACCRWELERRHMTPPSNFALRIIVEEDRRTVPE
jgi:hypothetical protein